jgi:hypothetical protein
MGKPLLERGLRRVWGVRLMRDIRGGVICSANFPRAPVTESFMHAVFALVQFLAHLSHYLTVTTIAPGVS